MRMILLTTFPPELTVYQRTPIWVMPKLDVGFPPPVQRLFARIPSTQRIVRWFTDSSMEFLMLVAMWKYRYFKRLNITASNLANIHRFVSIRDRELRRKLTPDYDYGCKRPTVSNAYYRALTKPHVHLETSGIERIEAAIKFAGRIRREDWIGQAKAHYLQKYGQPL